MNLQKFTDFMNIYFLRKNMKYSFPQPTVVPSKIKKTVMQNIYSSQNKSLIKRSFFVTKISWYALVVLFLSIFSLIYFDTPYQSHQTQQISYEDIETVVYTQDIKDIDISTLEEDIEEIESLLVQTEDILSELDDLI